MVSFIYLGYFPKIFFLYFISSVQSVSHVRLFVTPWTAAYQAPPSVGFSRQCSLGISKVLKRSLVFPILLFSSISLHWSLRKALLSLLAILWNSAFRWVYLSFSLFHFFLTQLFVKPPQTGILLFHIYFSWWWFWSLPSVQCYEPPSIVLQALCLSDLILWIY